jgi:hypothetical protein
MRDAVRAHPRRRRALPGNAVSRAPLTASYRLAVGCAWLGFVWATTHWYSWQQMIDLLYGSDMAEYEQVARAAPGLPDQPLPSQHADRFIPHYLVGLASDLFQVGDRPLYYGCAIVLLLVILALVDRALSRLELGRAEYALCIGALLANPYLFRYLAIGPAMLGDSVFVLGGAVALLGLLRARGWILVAGLTIATLGRSEAVFPLVALAPLGVALSPDWRRRPLRLRRIAAVSAFAVPIAAYTLVRVIDSSFSVADHPGFRGLTIFGSLASLPHSGGHIGTHLARTFIGIAGASGLLAGVLVARRSVRTDSLPFGFWAALGAGIAVSGEAVVLNPEWLNGSEPLLASLGTAFLVVAAALALGARDPHAWGIRRVPTVVAIGGLVLTSLHHRYSAISPVGSPLGFAVLASVGAATVAAAVAVGARTGSVEEIAGSSVVSSL